MNIVHVASIEPSLSGGMSRVAYHWRHRFQEAGHVFVHLGPQAIGRSGHYSTFSLRVRRHFEKMKPPCDVLLLHESAGWAFRSSKLPKVHFSHGLEARFAQIQAREPEGRRLRKRIFARLYQALIWRALQSADAVLVLNTEDLEYCTAHGLERSRVHLFSNGVSPSLSTRAMPSRPQTAPCTVLFNGSWISRKGVGELVEAATRLKADGLNLRWLLIGTGAAESVVRSHWPENLQTAVQVVPHFSPQEEAIWLQQADIFILPSHFEGQPLALLEAMAAGLPCISTQRCGQKDLIDDGENGSLIAPGHPEAIANAVRTLAQDEGVRTRLGRAAAQRVQSLTWERVPQDVVNLVEKVVADAQARPVL